MWVLCFFFFFLSMRRKWSAPRRERKKHRGGQRGCLIVFGLYAVFFDWPRNCPADSNLIRHPQIKHGSSSSKQKRSNTALPNKQSALYFHLLLSFIYFLFYLFFPAWPFEMGTVWQDVMSKRRKCQNSKLKEERERDALAICLNETSVKVNSGR